MKFIHTTAVAIILAMTLFMSGQAAALTVYDVIQLSNNNYSDKEIVKLIKVTNSAFTLKAKDIPDLMKLGVTEPVIQSMLEARGKPTTTAVTVDSAQIDR